MSYISPEFEKKGFNCPNCDAYAKQDWKHVYGTSTGSIYVSQCQHCSDISIWFGKETYSPRAGFYVSNKTKMIYPKKTSVPLPNEDLEQEVKDDYIEASNILNDSPRGAGGLLRLALQKLMVQLGEDGKHIDSNIGSLVEQGLSPTIQQALDSVRVIGNESVHPGELDLKDDIDAVTKIFGLINIIADSLITQPKKIKEIYGTLPEGKREGIENRDK